jgi:hypothetical protein
MFFSARRIIGEVFGQVKPAVEKYLKTGGRVTEMDPHHAIVKLPSVAIVLPTDAHSFFAALGRPRLVDASDRFGMGMLDGHDLLAAISQLFFIPLD